MLTLSYISGPQELKTGLFMSSELACVSTCLSDDITKYPKLGRTLKTLDGGSLLQSAYR